MGFISNTYIYVDILIWSRCETSLAICISNNNPIVFFLFQPVLYKFNSSRLGIHFNVPCDLSENFVCVEGWPQLFVNRPGSEGSDQPSTGNHPGFVVVLDLVEVMVSVVLDLEEVLDLEVPDLAEVQNLAKYCSSSLTTWTASPPRRNRPLSTGKWYMIMNKKMC